ncbi:MAG TPA: hypothetical protein VFH68_03125 [Polyangia bacterium]|nr:hypothetical protein [Polyangia bacterium]
MTRLLVSAPGVTRAAAAVVTRAPARIDRDRVVVRWALVALLVAITLLQRFGVNFGSYSLNAGLLAMYGFLAVAASAGVLTVSLPRLIAVAASASVALMSTFVNAERASGSSLALLGAMYLPFAFMLAPRGALSHDDAAQLFGTLAWLCGLAGVLQFYAQFVLHVDWLFDFTAYLPAWLRGPGGFNTVIPVGGHYKSNGFFFREPSGFSFLMALALVMECLGRRRAPRIVVFALALLLTYSGTGLLALVIGALVPPHRKTLGRLVLLAAIGGVAFWLLDDALNLSFTLGRLDEFGSERSSGYIRYIAPGRLLAETASAEPVTLWLGHGPGSISRKEAGFEFHDPTWAKLIFEYGLLGFVAFVTLFLMALRRSAAPLRVRAMLFAAWLVMGGHLLSPEQNFLTLALVGLFPHREAA